MSLSLSQAVEEANFMTHHQPQNKRRGMDKEVEKDVDESEAKTRLRQIKWGHVSWKFLLNHTFQLCPHLNADSWEIRYFFSSLPILNYN